VSSVHAIAGEGWLDEVRWDGEGLLPAIAQDAATGEVLMFAWMNREALAQTVVTGEAVYWSRSRKRLWHKGEESGHTQTVRELRLDCDKDVLLLKIEQNGGIACHTGRRSCFFNRLETSGKGASSSTGASAGWRAVEPILKDPKDIYK